MFNLETIKSDIKEEIKEYVKTQNLFNLICIYFLFQDNNVVYIGCTKRIKLRIKEHAFAGKIFNKIFYFHMIDIIEARKREKELIKKYKPKFNLVDVPYIERYYPPELTKFEFEKIRKQCLRRYRIESIKDNNKRKKSN